MSTQQPKWRLLGNLGDVSPIDYGGYFVYVDETGVYEAEAEVLLSPDSDDAPEGWTVYRFELDRCTYVDGVLSDNAYHPEHAAWFCPSAAERAARPQDSHLGQVADCVDIPEAELIRLFCSADPLDRARAYQAIGDYHGYENLDGYPLQFKTRAEVEARYDA